MPPLLSRAPDTVKLCSIVFQGTHCEVTQGIFEGVGNFSNFSGSAESAYVMVVHVMRCRFVEYIQTNVGEEHILNDLTNRRMT